MEEPGDVDVVAQYRARGFTAFKIGWGPFGRALDARLDEAIVRAAREAAGDAAKLFVDAGASDALWPHGFKWAKRTAEMLKDFAVGWFEEPVRPDAIDDYWELRRCAPVPIAGGEVLTRRQAFIPWLTRGALDIVQPDVTKVGGISRAAPHRLDGLRFRHQICRARLEHGARRGRRPADGGRLSRRRPRRVHRRQPLCGRHPGRAVHARSGRMLAIPDRPGLGVTIAREKLARYTPIPRRCFYRCGAMPHLSLCPPGEKEIPLVPPPQRRNPF